MYIVELEKGCWLDIGNGDPSRTMVKDCAQQYKTKPAAKGALTNARKFRKFANAEINKI